MKTLNEYIEEAEKLGVCREGIEYAKKFNTIEEFINSSNSEFIAWFFDNCDVEEEVYYMLEDKNYVIRYAYRKIFIEDTGIRVVI